jgi:hypothetical protein
MNPYKLTDFVITVIFVLFIAGLASGLGPALDYVDALDKPTQSVVDAQQDAEQSLRIDMAAAALCREQYGNSAFTWTAGGELVCIPRKGP